MESSPDAVRVTRKVVRERAVELPACNGRPAHEASKSDWEQAKWELSGNSVTDRTALQSTASFLVRTPLAMELDLSEGSGDNKEGLEQSPCERLVEEGIREAGHGQVSESNLVSGQTTPGES